MEDQLPTCQKSLQKRKTKQQQRAAESSHIQKPSPVPKIAKTTKKIQTPTTTANSSYANRQAAASSSSVSSQGQLEWKIEALMLGDGKHVLSKTFEVEKWYGSNNAFGGAESYHQVDIFSVKFDWSEVRNGSLSTKKITNQQFAYPKTFKVPAPANTRLQTPRFTNGQRGHVVLGKVQAFCRQYPGVAVLFHRVGKRQPSRELRPFLIPATDHLRKETNQFDCSLASIINCIQYFTDEAKLLCIIEQLKECNLQFTNLGQIGSHLRTLGLRLNLRKPHCMSRIKAEKYNDGFKIVASFSTGIWLVRLATDSRMSDHSVVVNGEKSIILDSEERWAIRLSPLSLRMCGGPSTAGVHIAEVLEVFRY